jgi:hypothetical protein
MQEDGRAFMLQRYFAPTSGVADLDHEPHMTLYPPYAGDRAAQAFDSSAMADAGQLPAFSREHARVVLKFATDVLSNGWKMCTLDRFPREVCEDDEIRELFRGAGMVRRELRDLCKCFFDTEGATLRLPSGREASNTDIITAMQLAWSRVAVQVGAGFFGHVWFFAILDPHDDRVQPRGLILKRYVGSSYAVLTHICMPYTLSLVMVVEEVVVITGTMMRSCYRGCTKVYVRSRATCIGSTWVKTFTLFPMVI